ncbi:helix-turn-helix domain-containing protein [Flavobacterium sp. ZB4P13]|uniref:helix-turn-helix domain-containing protein n=1 Tax=Flavobacterium sp. ZB4P13 TaxID=3401728 RepID=UPI003AAAAAA7
MSNKEYLILQDKVRMLTNSNIDSAFIYTNRIGNSSNNFHKGFAAGAESYLFQIKGDSIKSRQIYKEAFIHLNKISPSKEKRKLNAYLLNYGGLSDWKRGSFSKALDKYQEGEKLSESIGDQIQVVKFKNNIALIKGEVGNYKSAISTSKQTNKILDEIGYLFSKEQFSINKSNVNLNLGKFYEDYYKKNNGRTELLDSAQFFYNKAVIYSEEMSYNKVRAIMNLANIYYLKNNFIEAEKNYQSVLIIAKDNDFENEYFKTIYNLGNLYYFNKDYKKALIFLKKVDSAYYSKKNNQMEFLKSNYYQAKIYSSVNNLEEAAKHSEIYLSNYEKSEFKLNKEITEVNFKLSEEGLKSEMYKIQKGYRYKSMFNRLTISFFLILVGLLLLLVINNTKKKRIAERKIAELTEKYKLNEFNDLSVISENYNSKEIALKNSIVTISLEKEKEILEKLKILEKKSYYLKPDFTQQYAARKIKTNTSYLSIIVNKHYNKTFSGYLNELRINYVIKEMISNSIYRKYSTQAIAESAGFKNAVSFTKSFNKRTGVTPVQFIKGLEKNS